MANKGKFELNTSCVASILHSEELESNLEEDAKAIQRKAGKGFGISTGNKGSRIVASVMTRTRKAEQDCERSNALLKAVN